MKIVIIGCGTIGKTILHYLSTEDHSVTIVDQDGSKIEELIEKYDVMGVVGNGACLSIQEEAGIQTADLVIAVTSSDEINILACLVAKKIGAEHTIARVRSPEYHDQSIKLRKELGLSMIVNPEQETAAEIRNIINLPSVAKIEHFAKGKVSLVELLIEENNPLIGESLTSIGKKLNTKALICAIQRGEEVIIPNGKMKIKQGDRINFTAEANTLGQFLAELNLTKTPNKNIMIVGGGGIAYYLAKGLSERKHSIKLIEEDKERAEELAQALPKVNVINGDGTDHDVLLEEGIESMDAFVALTNIDEENIIASMYASKFNIKKVVTKIKREGLLGMIRDLGINNNISPKDVVSSKILSYVRALENTQGSNVVALYKLVNDQIEALEFIAKNEEDDIYEKQIKDLEVRDNCLIACIIRDGKVIIPNGMDHIELNDSVIVVTKHTDFDDLTDVFES